MTKRRDKKEALLDATLTLVNNHGFHAAPMSKIAKLAGVSPATIYIYFENKQDMMNAIYLKSKRAMADAAFDGYSSDMSVKRGFELMWRNVLEFKMTHKREATLLEQCETSPIVGDEILKEGISYLSPMSQLLRRGIDENIIKNAADYELYAYAFYPLTFISQNIGRSQVSNNDLNIDMLFSMAWDSIRC
ncbi:TetR/AcrR family transcriptional regulator [Halosquirtibacter xylanolyticus]|uniref:TetR/AcrR family transcriptional regulator n=1 Tax=Halosquirtibacter xylanolyticus TaxID=3374599 RepID=UPI0037479255|nr:TetR/AcrR family transcriptional regulator [Prolixibacteraceae bacterium]